MDQLRVSVYIDGFNLYHGLKEHSKAREYRWLNLWSLSESLLRRGHRLERVLYFTSLPPWNPRKVARHQAYLAALTSVGVEIIMGRFQKDLAFCYADCKQPFDVYTEKLTDVHIATSILRDAVLDRFDWAYLVTGDADQAPTIRTLRAIAPTKEVYVVFPPRRHANELATTAVAHIGPLSARKIKPHIFPDEVSVGNRVIHKPEGW